MLATSKMGPTIAMPKAASLALPLTFTWLFSSSSVT